MRHTTMATKTINATTQPATIPPTLLLPLSSFCSRVASVEGVVVIISALKLVIKLVLSAELALVVELMLVLVVELMLVLVVELMLVLVVELMLVLGVKSEFTLVALVLAAIINLYLALL